MFIYKKMRLATLKSMRAANDITVAVVVDYFFNSSGIIGIAPF